MEDAIRRSYQSRSRIKSSKCLKLFMAPEFYFRGKRGAYSMETYQHIVQRLRTYVHQDIFKDWLFVFGSCIATSKSSGPKREVYNIVFIQKGNKGEEDSCVVVKEFKSGLDFLELDRRSRLRSRDIDEKLMHEDVEHLPAGKGADKKRGRGKEQQTYSYEGLGIFTMDGITFGVEVCFDHSKRRLWLSPPARGENRVQIQLIPSAGMVIKDNAVVARIGGYVFNCDGNGDESHTFIKKITNKINPEKGYLKLEHVGYSFKRRTLGFAKSFFIHSGTEGMSLTDFRMCFQSSLQRPVIHLTKGLKIPSAQRCRGSENPHWVPYSASKKCHRCKKSIRSRDRVHCSGCGRIFHRLCTLERAIASSSSNVRVCRECPR